MPTTANDILVRAVMENTTGLPQDRYVNDFAFRKSGAPPTILELTGLMSLVSDFYRLIPPPSTRAVGEWIGDAVNRAATHELQAYSISAGGSPIHSIPWLGPPSPIGINQNLPTEVAAVLSFHADLTGIPEEVGVTRPKARRRGRIYIGPLINAAITPTDDDPRLDPTFLTAARRAIIAMQDAADLQGWAFSVWSRADNDLRPVVGGWTDNACDTQRRRGTAPSSRVVYSV